MEFCVVPAFLVTAVMVLFLFMSVAAVRIMDRSPHRLCGHELNISLVDGLDDEHNIVSMDDVLGNNTEELSCAIEVRDIAPDITEEILSMFFQNRKRSGGDEIEEVFFCAEERRAVITFTTPEGCVVP